MVYGMAEHTDEWGKKYHFSVKISGFRTEEQAVKAIARKGGVGYTLSERNILLHLVRDGQIKSVI